MSRLRKREGRFTTVDNAVAEDTRLSFRARGILVYLLAKPQDWSVRAEAIARDGKEGRDAVLAALRELGACGYYRIVRFRDGGPGGRWVTETEISPDPVAEWAAEWAVNGGAVIDRQKTEVTPGTGFSGPGEPTLLEDPATQVAPGTGFPASGNPASGRSAAPTRTLNNETQEPPTAAAAAGAPSVDGHDATTTVQAIADGDAEAGQGFVIRTLVGAYVDQVAARGGTCTGSLVASIGKNIKRVVEQDKIDPEVLLVAVQQAATKGLRSIDGILAAPNGPQTSWERGGAVREAMRQGWLARAREMDQRAAERAQGGAA